MLPRLSSTDRFDRKIFEDPNVPLEHKQFLNELEKEEHHRVLSGYGIALFGILMFLGLAFLGNLTFQIQGDRDGVLSQAQQTALAVSIGFAAVTALVFVWLFIYRLTSVTGVQDEDGRGRTSKTIAYFVLATFILGLGATYVAVLVGPQFPNGMPETIKSWLDTFRNAFILLGTALTTIIGFYFGAKQGEQAQDQLKKNSQELERKHQEVNRLLDIVVGPGNPPKAPAPTNPTIPSAD